MCTLVLSRRPGEPWPLLLAANRDELAGRPAKPPGRHWPDRPDVVGGLDMLAGGSWLALNDAGVVCAILNRRASLGPLSGKRSRGELVLDALDHADAAQAARALSAIEPTSWRPFNLVVADAENAFWLRNIGDGPVLCEAIPVGISFLEAGELNDLQMPRTRQYMPLFRRAARPSPDAGDWAAWQALMADRSSSSGNPRDAMCIVTDGEYGTRSSALIAIPRWPVQRPKWLQADGRPGEVAYVPVGL
jgi:uncharacterized protein with NRDE domain